MSNTPRWKLRTSNNCLFIDDVSLGKVILQHNARPGMRPYIHPLRIGDVGACLTEDSPWHHPWQHGIQTGFHGVNGCDFWFDPGQHPRMTIGTIEPSTPRILSQDSPCWTIEAIWRHADGSYLLAEQQTWSLQESDDLLYLDLDWMLRAIPDVQIEQHNYGGLFVRMPFRQSSAASVLNSNGMRDDDTEQQAAAWVDIYMPLENSDSGGGITIIDHPANPDHPAKWRVDNQRGINPAPCIRSAIELSAGVTMNHRYRLILHSGQVTAEKINAVKEHYYNMS